jgi:hypothetical protein
MTKRDRVEPYTTEQLLNMKFYSPNTISNAIEEGISENEKLDTIEEKWSHMMRFIDNSEYLSHRFKLGKDFLNSKHGKEDSESTDPYVVLENDIYKLGEHIKSLAQKMIEVNQKFDFELFIRLIPSRAKLSSLNSYSEIEKMFRGESGLFANFKKRREITINQLKTISNLKSNDLNKYIRIRILNRRVSMISACIKKLEELENFAYQTPITNDPIAAIKSI